MRAGWMAVACAAATLAVVGCGGSDDGGQATTQGGQATTQQGGGAGDRQAQAEQAAQAIGRALTASDGEGFCRALTQSALNEFGAYVEGTGPIGGRRTCQQFVERFAETDPLLRDAKPTDEVSLTETGATVASADGPPLALAEEDGAFKLALDRREGFAAVTDTSEACIARQDQRLNNRLPSANRNLMAEYYLREAGRTARLRDVVAKADVRAEEQTTKVQLLRFLDSEEQVGRNVARDLRGDRNLASGGASGQGNRLLRFQRRSDRFLKRLGVVCERYGDAADQVSRARYAIKANRVCVRSNKAAERLPDPGSTPASIRRYTTAFRGLTRRTNAALKRFKAPRGFSAPVRRTLGASSAVARGAAEQDDAVANLDQGRFDAAIEDLQLAQIRSQIAWAQLGLPACGGF